MRRVVPLLLFVFAACAPGMGDPRPVPVPTVAFRADDGADAVAVAQAIRQAAPRLALVMGPADAEWFTSLAGAVRLEHTRPGTSGGMGLAFLGPEAVGDTTLDLRYADGQFTLHDALYDFGDRRFVDLLAFAVDDPASARPIVTALAEYIATDVPHNAAIIMAVAVASEAVGDSLARVLSPAYRDARGCGAAATPDAPGLRLFFGPEVRAYCREAVGARVEGGTLIHADLVVGRR
jgi:hypothetical protein